MLQTVADGHDDGDDDHLMTMSPLFCTQRLLSSSGF